MDEKFLMQLHGRFDEMSLKIKKKKMKEQDEDMSGLAASKEQWQIPLRIIAFCKNRIMFFINNPDKVENYELLPWFKFKNTLFDIYDHRILHSPELNGSVNTNYCSLNEHLLVYYMDHYRTRDKAEEKIISLLINLRYYHEHWQRAKTFTWNMQLTVISDSPNRPFGHEDTPKSEDLN